MAADTLRGRDAGYAPAIKHALASSDAVSAVSESLKRETQRVLDFDGPIEVIHNFFAPRPPTRPSEVVRRELGLGDEVLVVHSSNLRHGKRVDLLLETVSRGRRRASGSPPRSSCRVTKRSTGGCAGDRPRSRARVGHLDQQ